MTVFNEVIGILLILVFVLALVMICAMLHWILFNSVNFNNKTNKDEKDSNRPHQRGKRETDN